MVDLCENWLELIPTTMNPFQSPERSGSFPKYCVRSNNHHPPINKLNNKGRKRLHPRIEELRHAGCEIDIRKLVTNHPDAVHYVIDQFGNRLDFVDQIVRHQMVLQVYVNNIPYCRFQLVERPMPGRINAKVDPDKKFFYYVVVDGRRFKKLYCDLGTGKIGVAGDTRRGSYL